MRTTPKYFLILAVMAGATVVTASCASDGPSTAPGAQDTRTTQTKLQDLHAKYDWIGKYHTDGLAYIYTQLAKGKGKPRTRAQMCQIVAKATRDFHKAQRHSDVPANLVDASLMNGSCPAEENGKGINKTLITLGTPGTPRHDLSEGAVSLINQIGYLANTAASDDEFLGGIASIENQAAGLPSSDAGAVIGVASVARSSLEYWQANLSSWTALSSEALAYSVSPLDMTSATVSATRGPIVGPRFGPWYKNPFVQGFGRVLAADAMAAARTIYMAWEFGPIGWDAAAASAVFASATTGIALVF